MKSILLAFLLLTVTNVFATDNPDAILGLWKNGTGKGHIQIFKEGNKYYGKLVWLRDAKDEAGKPKVDRHNPDKEMQTRPLMGLVILRDFVFEDGEWTNGRVYNPSDGKDYKGTLKLKDPKTLDVRGYVGFSFIGKTDTWTRIE